jgi:hypothetical protein
VILAGWIARYGYERGGYLQARALNEKVLEARVRLLGKEHPDTLRAMANLTVTLSAQGDFAGARKLQEQVLEASIQLLGREHPGTLTTMDNLAVSAHQQGNLAEARELHEQVLELRFGYWVKSTLTP